MARSHSRGKNGAVMQLAKIIGVLAAALVLVLAAGYAANEDPETLHAEAQAPGR